MAIVDLLLPPSCAGCGRYGVAFCTRCRSQLRPASRPEDRFLAPDGGVVVGDALEMAVAAFAYGGTLRHSLSRLKYGGAARLARPLAEAAQPAFTAFLEVTGDVTVVPVPVHPERRRERGYNQATLLARVLATAARLPVAEILVRRRPTTQQHRLDRAARLRNLRDAFALEADARPPPTALLLDDILTTSATMEACAAVLRGAGATRVWGFALAREI